MMALDDPILAEHATAIRRLGKFVLDNVIEIGRRLTEAKEICGHGKWLPWLDREFAWKERTAQRYINVYEAFGSNPSGLTDLELPLEGLYLLAAPSTPPETRAEIIKQAEAGELVTVAVVKAAISKTKPKFEEPKPPRGVNPACVPLFKNEDQLEAFVDAVTTRAARRFISLEQQLALAKQIVDHLKDMRRGRVPHIKNYVSAYVHDAARAQGKIDAEETEDIYKQMPGFEIRDEVAAATTAARKLIVSLVKLKVLVEKFTAQHPFFGDIGFKLDDVIGTIRQYRRAAGEDSADEVERKLMQLDELKQKVRRQEITITGLRSEIEELRGKPNDP
jgi:hypothetical protein